MASRRPATGAFVEQIVNMCPADGPRREARRRRARPSEVVWCEHQAPSAAWYLDEQAFGTLAEYGRQQASVVRGSAQRRALTTCSLTVLDAYAAARVMRRTFPPRGS